MKFYLLYKGLLNYFHQYAFHPFEEMPKAEGAYFFKSSEAFITFSFKLSL